MKRRILAGIALPCCLAAACGSTGSTTPDLHGLKGKTADQVLALAEAAMVADAQSFHFVDVTKQGSHSITLIGDDTDRGAQQSLQGDVSALEVLRTPPGGVYVRGAPNALEDALDLSSSTATAYAGKWISLQPGDGPYSTVATALDPQKEVDSYIPVAPLHLVGPRTFRGQQVVGVSGTAPSTAANGSGKTVTLYVPTVAPYTPLGATLTFGSGESSGIEAVVFGKWGEKVYPAAPAGAVPYRSLPR